MTTDKEISKTFSYEEALATSLDYFGGDELASKAFVDKYALRNNDNELVEKSPDDTIRRIVKEIERVEKKKFKKPLTFEEIYLYFDHFQKAIPQGGILNGVGNTYQYVSCANCFAIEPPEDSYSGIMRADEELVQISKRRGGTGLSLSNIRPIGTPTKNAARTSTGIIPFAERFSNSIREVCMGGRRGALLLSLSIHHPEVLAFVKAKRDLTKITGANISVCLSDEFMKAVIDNNEYELRWPIDSKNPAISKWAKAKEMWDEIIKSVHICAEPGLLFWDTIIRESIPDCYSLFGFSTIGLNPCSELILQKGGECLLMAINLFSYVKKPFTSEVIFDYEELYKDIQVITRLMDDIVDLELECIDTIIDKVNRDPEPEELKSRELNLWKNIRKSLVAGRRVGISSTGLGDVLAALGVKYASKESFKVADKIFLTIKRGCYKGSVDLAKELGSFPVWDHNLEKHNPFLLRIKDEDPELWAEMKKNGRRNINLLTCSPAGTISLLTQTTSGIEPLFQIKYTRRKKVNPNDKNARVDFIDPSGDCWQEFEVIHPKIKMWMEITGEKDISKSPWFKCCAEDLNWEDRVKLQGIIQRHIDNSISSTVNLPEDVSENEVAKIYLAAYRENCKGITVYRKGSRTGVLVDTGDKNAIKMPKTQAPKRPESLPCDIHHVKITKRLDKNRTLEYIVAVGLFGQEPYEIFSFENGKLDKKYGKGKLVKKARGRYNIELEDGKILENIMEDQTEEEEAITRLASTALRHGADIAFIVHQLEKVRGDLSGFTKSMSRALKKYILDGKKVTGESCPECSKKGLEGDLIRENGCILCRACGYSKCS